MWTYSIFRSWKWISRFNCVSHLLITLLNIKCCLQNNMRYHENCLSALMNISTKKMTSFWKVNYIIWLSTAVFHITTSLHSFVIEIMIMIIVLCVKHQQLYLIILKVSIIQFMWFVHSKVIGITYSNNFTAHIVITFLFVNSWYW